MYFQRKLLRSVRMLASGLFKTHRKPGSARHRQSEWVTEFHPAVDGTLLVVRCGERSLSRIVSAERYARPFACSPMWLKACEGQSGAVDVGLNEDHVDINWQAESIPQTLRLPTVDVEPLAMTPPLTPVNAGLITALAATGTAVDRESLRYSLSCVQLDAARGTVTGTDGHRMIRYDGFQFPWGDTAILLPANDAFSSPILRDVNNLSCGLSEQHLVIEAAPWTLRLPIQTEGRYPDVSSVIGKLTGASNRVHFDPRDLAFIAKHLKRFPGDDLDHSPVSLELGAHVDLAACGDERSRAIRLRLSRTRHTGNPITLSMNRQFFSHAAQCGITDLLGFGDQRPVVCRGPNLVYVWQPLSGVRVPPRAPETLQIETVRRELATAS